MVKILKTNCQEKEYFIKIFNGKTNSKIIKEILTAMFRTPSTLYCGVSRQFF